MITEYMYNFYEDVYFTEEQKLDVGIETLE